MGFFNKNEDYDNSEYIENELREEVEDALEEAKEQEASEETADEKRENRRKRRKQNEMMVYISTFLVLILLTGGVFAGINAFKGVSGSNNAETASTEDADDIQNIVDSMLASETELPSEVVDVVTPEEQLDEFIDTIIAGMTLEEKVAGLIITSPEQLTGVNLAVRAGSGTQEALQKMPVGGLVYYRKNMQDKAQLTEMLSNTITYSKYPIFLAVNEGGDNASSVQNSPITVPVVTEPGDIKTLEEAQALGSTIGTYLAELNFNVNFAPTADILYVADAAVKDYCFGGDAAMNGQFVAEYVKAMENAGISAAVKTFPGTGYLRSSTTDGPVSTDRDRGDFEPDFSVFKAGIEAGADFVMVSNIIASELSGGMDPCSMSSTVVTDILRNELQYSGIIITEPMNGKAITEYYSASEAAVGALKAGCDMILLPENLDEAYQGILEGVANGSVAEARINDSLKRVFRVKYADKLAEFAE